MSKSKSRTARHLTLHELLDEYWPRESRIKALRKVEEMAAQGDKKAKKLLESSLIRRMKRDLGIE